MIKIKNLVKTYGKIRAVDDLSLTINEGEIFALLGLNGAGKSTTIKVLCLLTQKTGGKLDIAGLDLDEKGNEIKKIINLSPQETAVANNLTVRENLELICDLYGINNVGDAVDKYLKTLDLESKEKCRARSLSGGQKRRLSLAMALITEPKILILDEPTLGLDVKSRKELWRIISECKGKTTVVLTTHYLEEAERLADRIGVMRKGKLVALGSAKEIVDSVGATDFENAFLVLAGGEDE